MTEFEVFETIFSCNNEHSEKKFNNLLNLTIEQKVQASKVRIGEWYNYFNGNVYVVKDNSINANVLVKICKMCYNNIDIIDCNRDIYDIKPNKLYYKKPIVSFIFDREPIKTLWKSFGCNNYKNNNFTQLCMPICFWTKKDIKYINNN